MKKLIFVACVCVFLCLPHPVFAQDDSAAIIPWMGLQEYSYYFLPAGGWNALGATGIRSLAMGETLLSNTSWASSYLNPAVLSQIPGGQASVSYRYSDTAYKINSPGYLYMINPPREEKLSFDREEGALDGAGMLMPFGRWTVAAGYFLYQDFDLPEVRNPYWWPWSVKQSGRTRGVNLGLSHRFSSAFSMGLSATYIFGGIDRVEVSPLYFILREGPGAGPNAGRLVERLPGLRFPFSMETTHDLSLRGFVFNLGFVFKPNEKWVLGVALRPPFKLGIEGEITSIYYGFDVSEMFQSAADSDMYYPFLGTVSVLFHPVRPFQMTADLSYTSWSEFATDYPSLGYAAWYGFRNTIRMNLGAEYLLRLPFRQVDGLALRMGYAYDPQPYMYEDVFARNFVCFGFGLKVGRLDIESGAKLALFSGRTQKFQTSGLRFGLSYRFD